jgi:hypothetical protein
MVPAAVFHQATVGHEPIDNFFWRLHRMAFAVIFHQEFAPVGSLQPIVAPVVRDLAASIALQDFKNRRCTLRDEPGERDGIVLAIFFERPLATGWNRRPVITVCAVSTDGKMTRW